MDVYKIQTKMNYALIFGYCLCLVISTQAQNTDLRLFSSDGLHFYVYLDGNLQTASPEKYIKIKAIPEGDYHLKLDFYNTEIDPLTYYGPLHAKQENILLLKRDETKGWYLEKTTKLPSSLIDEDIAIYDYTRSGVEKQANIRIEDEPKVNLTKSHNGVFTGDDLEDRRDGMFSFSDKDMENNTSEGEAEEEMVGSVAPNPNKSKTNNVAGAEEDIQNIEEEQMERRRYYTKIDKQGYERIVEEVEIDVKTTVQQGEMQLVKTKTQLTKRTTNYTCFPMGDNDFYSLKASIKTAEMPGLFLTKEMDGKCFSPRQLKILVDLLEEDTDKMTFALAAKEICADPYIFPLANWHAKALEMESLHASTEMDLSTEKMGTEEEDQTISAKDLTTIDTENEEEEENKETIVKEERKELDPMAAKKAAKEALKLAKRQAKEAKKIAQASRKAGRVEEAP